MIEPKFTKGPWFVDPIEYSPTDENNIYYGYPSIQTDKYHVAQLCDLDNAEANSNLIAAAPEMYEALMAVRNMTIVEFDGLLVEQVENALKKARGEE